MAEGPSTSPPFSAAGSQRGFEAFRTMVLIRRFEEAVADLVEQGQIKTPCHLYIGQEAVATGVCHSLRKEDSVWGNHRSHGHYLAKGGDLQGIASEILCRRGGCSGGRGGSMHLVAPEVGIMGTVPIVGATVPLAVGAGLAAKRGGRGEVAVVFFGDGTVEEGHVHEAMNLAALYDLPVLFVCENNLYSSHMHLVDRRREDNIVAMADYHGFRGEQVDGNDVDAVGEVARDLIGTLREGRGPALIEARTFRWRGHVGHRWDMDVGVRRKDELDEWIRKDPIELSRKRLVESGIGTDLLGEVEARVAEEVEESLRVALEDEQPGPEGLNLHVFVENG